MFLRATVRKKDGKEHTYYSVAENKRLADGRVVQRHVLCLGEINSSQQLAWRKPHRLPGLLPACHARPSELTVYQRASIRRLPAPTGLTCQKPLWRARRDRPRDRATPFPQHDFRDQQMESGPQLHNLR
jgi:hypothetical protein